ncbi:hypothetical protein [Methanolapillus millepedarum]|uniref:Uncharacterized protein n=1 Tax=Methanolapillus millepedarum TaxID=3028296 RepID=A0AA96V5D0_9EURY|nr:hypothetical protein MsAc7_17880 [Methanosarcinaceae archaeon Ac7]
MTEYLPLYSLCSSDEELLKNDTRFYGHVSAEKFSEETGISQKKVIEIMDRINSETGSSYHYVVWNGVPHLFYCTECELQKHEIPGSDEEFWKSRAEEEIMMAKWHKKNGTLQYDSISKNGGR